RNRRTAVDGKSDALPDRCVGRYWASALRAVTVSGTRRHGLFLPTSSSDPLRLPKWTWRACRRQALLARRPLVTRPGDLWSLIDLECEAVHCRGSQLHPTVRPL